MTPRQPHYRTHFQPPFAAPHARLCTAYGQIGTSSKKDFPAVDTLRRHQILSPVQLLDRVASPLSRSQWHAGTMRRCGEFPLSTCNAVATSRRLDTRSRWSRASESRHARRGVEQQVARREADAGAGGPCEDALHRLSHVGSRVAA